MMIWFLQVFLLQLEAGRNFETFICGVLAASSPLQAHVFVKDLFITFYIFLFSFLRISLFTKCFTIAKECISKTTGWRKLCYSGRWKMLVVGVRSGTTEVQLPKVWTISRGVKPYLEQCKKLMWGFCSTSLNQPVGGVYICSSLNQQLDHLHLVALNCRVQPWNRDIEQNAKIFGYLVHSQEH